MSSSPRLRKECFWPALIWQTVPVAISLIENTVRMEVVRTHNWTLRSNCNMNVRYWHKADIAAVLGGKADINERFDHFLPASLTRCDALL